jgi:hypothetical protein
MKKVVFTLVGLAFAASLCAAPAPDSKRLALAKDYIADEQWTRAIRELRAVADDANDPSRDEALFWLAHSEHQVGDQMAALETIARLERLFARSRWVRPARSLRVEIAQRLQRDDVLWVLAAPQPTTAPPPRIVMAPQPAPSGAVPAPAPPSVTVMRMPPRSGSATPQPSAQPPGATPPASWTPMPGAPGALPPPASTPAPGATPPAPGPTPPMRMRALPMAAMPEGLLPTAPYVVDTDLKIEALVGLLDTHSDRVIPLLRDIALDNRNPSEARRAVFALAQSNRLEARNTVLEAARRGAGPVRIAAIRELGRFREPVFISSLVTIARGESDPGVRDTAIVTLGRSGARPQLRSLYHQLPPGSRFVVLTALFNAKDDDELIRIATNERDQRLRTHARQQLRLLATPKAVKFLAENP